MNPNMSKPKSDTNIVIPEGLIKELLTKSELRMVQKRLQIIRLLQEGLSIRIISKRANVGTDTVVRISRKLESSEILKKSFTKFNFSDSSKWIFGDSGED